MSYGIYPWINSAHIQLGSGFDTLNFIPRGRGVFDAEEVDVKSFSDDPESNEYGQKVEYSLELIENERDFRDSLSINASVAFKGIGVRGSARLSIYEELTINTYDVFLLAKVSVLERTEGMKKPSFTEEAVNEWKNTRQSSQKAIFTKIYGNTFVNSITLGGEMFVVFQFSSNSRKEKRDIIASMSGKMGSWQASASFEKHVEDITKNRTTKLFFTRDGGSGQLPSADVASLLTACRDMPTHVRKEPVPIFFEAQDYSAVPVKGFDVDVTSLETKFFIEDLALVLERARQYRTSWDFVSNNIELFSKLKDEDARDQKSRLDEIVLELHRLGERVIQNRFADWAKTKHTTIAELSIPPSITSGHLLSTVLRTNWAGLYKESDGGIIEGSDLRSFSISSKDIPEGITLEYMAHIGHHGDKGWWTSPAMSMEGRHEGIAVRLSGKGSENFVVRYWLGKPGSAEEYFGENGTFAGTTGNYQTVDSLRIQLLTA